MADMLIYSLLALALSLAPASESQVRIDLVNLGEGGVDGVIATRTDDGWSLKEVRKNEAPAMAKRQGDGFEFTVPGQKDPIHVALGDAAAKLAVVTVPTVFAVDGHEYTVVPSGEVYYVMAKGRDVLATVRPVAASVEVKATGTLRYVKVPAVKSPEAYQGIEFTLERDGEKPLPLTPSDSVTHEALVALDGRRIEVTGMMQAGRDPLPGEQYPIGPDGKPVPREDRLEVRFVREAGK